MPYQQPPGSIRTSVADAIRQAYLNSDEAKKDFPPEKLKAKLSQHVTELHDRRQEKWIAMADAAMNIIQQYENGSYLEELNGC